ncbi:sensor histidine kinase [Alkalihalobacillus alcalophilus ATCC 27647 = CGMCC 1.3604]|uniref:histidine kinase n=1 Tax=Alkalihalobacillus alcalophilus ATCC 27647 = CGMCC 1.3604 TaxID=1218173 RepID=A0A094YSS6_ALKAL|nr:sensor histidine kinase [Alkalihalobacillus alcalophilus]KGA96542.1 histidine kinase [Alkalihalobacillus alcalophilus ATCC 27647 = CGMCC 1.3604]MED1564151.1 sensor histidine kinase [Alkalihalobacillus alcalophilus]THG91838.1 sensor histidine kinase [Alkalihalobacillus alcalophilus ATCC 27647 = CGMCC 1.3604]
MGKEQFSEQLKKWLMFESKNGTAPYIWTVLCILPFYFIFQTDTIVTIIGVSLTLLFFLFYRIAYLTTKRWSVYIWTLILITISNVATYLFSYVYFSFFIAYLIGSIRNRIAFFILYFIHLVSIAVAINYMIAIQEPFFIQQLPFVLIVCLSIILLPFNIFNRNERGELEEKLEDANKIISDLIKVEERERIARDLHDTLGQKLSLIGLKSELARKLITKDPDQAKSELNDVQQTARTALSEVRKMVSSMRSIRLKDELNRVESLLKAAEIHCVIQQEQPLKNIALLVENILSMCLKEGVNNVVKHSGATECIITIEQFEKETVLTISDDGMFKTNKQQELPGYGLIGLKERLEFVNGYLQLDTNDGTTLKIIVPTDARGGDERI